jgi:hypothetical protein
MPILRRSANLPLMFEELYARAIGEWPKEIRLKVIPSGRTYTVEGLTSLEDGIASEYMGHPQEVLYRTLHWTISKAIHEALATRVSIKLANLPSLREKFAADLKITLQSSTWEDADRKVAKDYLARSRTRVPIAID